MKKLLLITLLLLSSYICFAQETFVKKYTSSMCVNNYVKDKLQSADITVVFNAGGVRDIVFYYPNGNTRTFHQIVGMTKGATTDGSEYQIVECLDESGERVAIQLFEDDKCLRVLVDKGYYVEFYKD